MVITEIPQNVPNMFPSNLGDIFVTSKLPSLCLNFIMSACSVVLSGWLWVCIVVCGGIILEHGGFP